MIKLTKYADLSEHTKDKLNGFIYDEFVPMLIANGMGSTSLNNY